MKKKITIKRKKKIELKPESIYNYAAVSGDCRACGAAKKYPHFCLFLRLII